MAPRSKALTVRKSSVPQLSEPDSQLYAMCVKLAESSAIPMAYIGKPDQIWSTVVYGREYKIGPMTSLCHIFNVNGKPSMDVHLILGLCQRHKDFAGWQVLKNTNEMCEVEMFRWNELSKKAFRFTASWTKAEAAVAGLLGKDSYKKYPKNLYKARAITFVAREAFADILNGVYSLEEMDPDAYIAVAEEDMRQVDTLEEEGKATISTKATPKRKPIGEVPSKKAKPVNKIAPNKGGR